MIRAPLLALALGLAACASAPPPLSAHNAAPTTVLFPAQASDSVVRAAVARALADRGYRIVSEQPGELQAVYERHQARLVVAVRYGTDRAVVRYVDSATLESAKYHAFMRKLERRIRDEVEHPPAAPVAERGPEPVVVVVEPARDVGLVRGAISRALVSRRYVIESEDGQRVVARYTHGDATMRIAVDYQTSAATISLVDRQNVELTRYDGWMRGLQGTLLSELQRTDAPEAVPVARGPEPMTVVVEPQRELGVVRGAVSRALVQRNYVVESESAQRITARYTHGSAFLRIAVDYQAERAVISFVSSENVALSRYEGWMRGLQETVQRELGRMLGAKAEESVPPARGASLR